MGWPSTWHAVSVPQVFAIAVLAKGTHLQADSPCLGA